MTIGLLSPVSHRVVVGREVAASPAPVSRPLPDTLDGVVAAISRVSGAALLSAAIEPASGHLRMALGGFGRRLVVDWVPG